MEKNLKYYLGVLLLSFSVSAGQLNDVPQLSKHDSLLSILNIVFLVLGMMLITLYGNAKYKGRIGKGFFLEMIIILIMFFIVYQITDQLINVFWGK